MAPAAQYIPPTSSFFYLFYEISVGVAFEFKLVKSFSRTVDTYLIGECFLVESHNLPFLLDNQNYFVVYLIGYTSLKVEIKPHVIQDQRDQ